MMDTDDYNNSNNNNNNNNSNNRDGGNYNNYNPSGSGVFNTTPFEDHSNRRKRPFSHPPHTDSMDDGLGFVKLYVAGIPITTTQQEIHSLFEAHGSIVEIAILREKRTGLPKECCFIKYTTKEEGDRAIAALNNRYNFPGATLPIKVRYAEGERMRLGNAGNHVLKLYVNGLNKQASKMDILEIFSTYGHVEDIHIVLNEFKQSRGFGFIQFARRDMAIAAINALNGTFVMAGCDQPLHVRFSEPKKPRFGDPRNISKLSDSGVGSHFQEQFVRPAPYLNDSMAGNVQSNVNHPFSPKTRGSSSQSPQIGGKSDTVCSSPIASDSVDCDWSEHTCPDGYKYYYNCVSCESRWEKPHEYSLFEQQLQNQHEYQQQQQRSGSCNHSQSPSTTPQELDHVQVPVRPNPLVETCG